VAFGDIPEKNTSSGMACGVRRAARCGTLTRAAWPLFLESFSSLIFRR
jgi:hypothetical protein